jgi:hypothetical protein
MVVLHVEISFPLFLRGEIDRIFRSHRAWIVTEIRIADPPLAKSLSYEA